MAESKLNRKLSAILFADIQGYTALMGKEETLALKLLEKFRQTLQKEIDAHQGEIIQWSGDGCLATFNSSVDAVECAKVAQEAFQVDLKVPVRMGLHSGDIVLKEGNIYGDAVNIASRIESMGVPGAVLLSNTVRNQIKSHPAYVLKELGSIAFKNVEEPLKVFALANPGFSIPEKIQGKLKEPAAPKAGLNRTQLGLFAIILVLAGFLIWPQIFGSRKGLLPDEIREARIAILPFENKTNDQNLDVLGEMAADWIVQAMMNMDDIKVVSTATVLENLPTLQMSAGGRQSFSKRTGAEKMIRGSFYPDGDQLLFQTQIIDAQTGEVEFVFPEISGLTSDKVGIVKEIRERVLTYFTMKSMNNTLGESSFFTIENPPKYEAFKLLSEAYSYFGNNDRKLLELVQKAIEVDSTFFQPYIAIFFTYSNRGQLDKADSIVQLIDERFDQLQPYEQLNFNRMKTYLSPNLEAQYTATKKLNAKDPKNLISNYNTGQAATRLNRLKEAIECFEQVEESYKEHAYESRVESWWNSNYASNLIRLNRLDKAMEVLNYVPIQKASNGVFYRKREIYVLRDQPDSLLQMIQELEQLNFPVNFITGLYVGTINEFAKKGDTTNQKIWAERAIHKIQNKPEAAPLNEAALGAAYYYNQQYEEALSLYQQQIASRGPSAFRLMRVGSCLAKLGRVEEAKAIIEKIKNLQPPKHRGQYTYNIAKIYSMLGDQEQAMNHIRQSYREGHGYSRNRYPNAFEFLPLRGYPPFEEFIRPKE